MPSSRQNVYSSCKSLVVVERRFKGGCGAIVVERKSKVSGHHDTNTTVSLSGGSLHSARSSFLVVHHAMRSRWTGEQTLKVRARLQAFPVREHAAPMHDQNTGASLRNNLPSSPATHLATAFAAATIAALERCGDVARYSSNGLVTCIPKWIS